MTDQRTDTGIRASLDERVAQALERAERRQAGDVIAVRPRRFAVRTDELQVRDSAGTGEPEPAARLDTIVIEQMEAHSAHELTVKLVTKLTARVEAAEGRQAEERAELYAHIDALTEAVERLTTKTRTQAGQITRLRNQLKALAEPAAD